MTPNVPRNAYTNSPEQHPNLILGSLQLLWWMIIHPSAFRNHLTRIDPDLKFDSSLLILIRKQRWRNLALWQLLIQGNLILPVLAALLLGLVQWGFGMPPLMVVAYRVAIGVAFSVAFSVVFNVAFGVAFGVVFNVAFMSFSMAFSVAFSVALSMALRVGRRTLRMAVSVAFGVGVGVAFGVGVGVGVTINLWLPVLLYPFLTLSNILLYQLDKRRIASQPSFLRSNILKRRIATKPSFLRWHSAFWDEWQRLPLQGLDKHVLLVIQRNPKEGKAALNYLSTSRQRWAAQAVQIELDARELEHCTDVVAISKAYRNLALGKLNSQVSSLLSSFSRISEDVAAALNQNSSYNQRLALTAIAERLNGFIREFTRSSDKYSVRFRPIATQWYEIVTNYIRELAEAVELRQEIDSPYIIGVPLTEQQKIFTGRTDIGTRIEQLILDRRRPPLLLYGQRRMGKTSLLNNMGRLLPNNIIPMFVDLQGPVSSASDYAGLLYNIAKGMIDSAKRQSALTLPSLNRETLQDDPFTNFDEWLDKVEEALKENIALLALDEFEALDKAITKGRFDEEDVLGMLRHLIQHRPRFKVLIAGSHTIEEFQRWASYLINVQVVHISYLKEPEARQLIEQPVKDFTLRYEPDAVDRVLQLTRCHPFLIQLLCGEIVVLKNEQDPSIRRLAILADVEAAIPEALGTGSFVFADIQNNQVDAAGLAILQFLAARGEGAIVSRQAILQQFPDYSYAFDLLLQRELIEEVGDGYRFQVELIRRWFVSSPSVM